MKKYVVNEEVLKEKEVEIVDRDEVVIAVTKGDYQDRYKESTQDDFEEFKKYAEIVGFDNLWESYDSIVVPEEETNPEEEVETEEDEKEDASKED